MWWLISMCFVVAGVAGLDNGLARTPPMGWMSWQRFRCITDCDLYPEDCISDYLFRRIADLMVSDGYLEAGYEYLIIDDCWLASKRDSHGRLQPDPDRFPYGIKNLSDYIHSQGLKFGLYEDYGTHTCAGYPGIKGHLKVDAETFAEWGVDYTKIDACYSSIDELADGYKKFGECLNKTGRPIVYSCSLPAYVESDHKHPNYTFLAEICNLWRNWGDIQDSYDTMQSILNWFGKNQKRIAPFAGPGHWNDPDMLLIGNFGLSYEQSKAQMALWAILAAPLLMSVDLQTIHPDYKAILLHEGAIAINQDPLGIQGLKVYSASNINAWTRQITPIKNGEMSYAIAFHSNRDDGYPFAIKISLRKLGLGNKKGYVVNDIFEPSEEKVYQLDDKFVVKVKPSGVVFLKAIPVVE